jgi:hypothetical protein
MVGRGKGMIGTPGASGGGTGAGWTAGAGVATTGVGAAGWGRGDPTGGLAAAGRAAAIFTAGEDGFLARLAAFGRADLAVGLALTFDVVARPFDFERRSELRGAPLPIRGCRSIWWLQV